MIEKIQVFVHKNKIYAVYNQALYQAMHGMTFECIGDTEAGVPSNTPAEIWEALKLSQKDNDKILEIKLDGKTIAMGVMKNFQIWNL